MPAAERGGALLQIDGQKRSLPELGDAAYQLAPGTHRVVIHRRGFEPVELSVALKAGEVHRFAPEWKSVSALAAATPGSATAEQVPPGFEGWTQRYTFALDRAAREKKDVLLAFVGSDWNEASFRLAQTVFPDAEFHRRADAELVLLVIDLPRGQEAYEQILDSAQNSMLREEYAVAPEEIPTLALLDPQGRPYAIAEAYESQTGQELLADIDAWKAQREERDRFFATIDALAGRERLDAAVAAVNWLRERNLTRFYGERFRQWEEIALREDPGNAVGDYEVLYEASWMVRLITANRNNDPALVEQVVSDFDAWRQKIEFHDPDRAARMHLVAAASMYQIDRQEEASRHIERALKENPKDEQLVAQLESLSQIFSGELSSGTGFVVAPGYLLTNYHVIEGPGRVVVKTSGSKDEQPATVAAQDEEHDLALLQVEGDAAKIPPLPLADALVGRGASVAAFGYPLGETLV
jgi:hypothetical protein